MVLKDMKALRKRTLSQGRKSVALVCADDDHALEAVVRARDIVDAVLIGDAVRIAATLEKLGERSGAYEILQPPQSVHPAVSAAQLIHARKADFIMKGRMMTGDLLRGLLSKEADLRAGGVMSHIALIEMPGYHKLLAVTDGGMCPAPDLDMKREIVSNAVGLFHALGYERPNIAALCAVEVVNPKMPETADAAALKELCQKDALPRCNLVGPISYDLAMNTEAAMVKGYDCDCTGDFDILLVPNITTGNVLSKCILNSFGGRMAGVILGCRVPIVLTSRGASSDEKFDSLALAAGMVGSYREH